MADFFSRRYYWAALLGFVLLWPARLLAGDVAGLNFIGFSGDGKTLAFEQYGIHDGSAQPHAEIFFIDVVKNRYAAKPLRAEPPPPGESETTLEALRDSLHQTAQKQLKHFGIEPGNRGEHLIAHSLHDIGVDPLRVKFSPQIPLANRPHEVYQLTLELTEAEKDCFGFGQAKKFTLKLTLPDGKSVQTLQADDDLPESRGCPLDYRIQDVYFYEEKNLAVFLNLFRPGFEGPEVRYLVVTGRARELPKGGALHD